MRSASSCPPDDELAGFREGRIDGVRVAVISEHLDACTACQAKLDENDTLVGLLRQKPPPAPTEAGYRWLESWALSDASQLYETPEDRSLERPTLRPAETGTADLGRVGPYRILRILGEGAMGVVYEAIDTRLDRRVALKALKPYWSRDDASRQRFLREAKAVAHVADERIVSVFDVGEDNGVVYIAMDLVKGESFEERLRARPRPSVAEIVDLGRQIAQGLAAAHAHGLVHRDIKPANIWIEHVPISEQTPHGLRVKLLDFGLARRLAEDVRLTRSGMVIGTPAYMAPEAARGEADARSDLFSLGCVLYRMATGAMPFPGKDTLAIIYALVHTNPVPPRRVNPAVPEPLSALVMKLLAKNPANRCQTAADVVKALDAPVANPRRRRAAALALAASLAASLVGFALLVAFWPKAMPKDDEVVANSGPPKPAIEKKPQVAPELSLEFEGDGKVELGEFPLTFDGPYTLEAYATPMPTTRTERQVVVGAGRQGAIEITQYRQPRPMWRFAWQFPSGIGTSAVDHGKRVHLAATYAGGVATLYIDGKNDGVYTQKAPAKPLPPFVLGENFVGTIDQARISNVVRYTGDFSPQKTLSADDATIALYLFRTGEGDILRDDSGHDRHGKIVSAKWIRGK